MIEVAILVGVYLNLAIIALRGVFERFKAKILPSRNYRHDTQVVEVKNCGSGDVFGEIRRDVVELVGELEKVSGWIGANRETNEARELVRRIKHEYGISSPE